MATISQERGSATLMDATSNGFCHSPPDVLPRADPLALNATPPESSSGEGKLQAHVPALEATKTEAITPPAASPVGSSGKRKRKAPQKRLFVEETIIYDPSADDSDFVPLNGQSNGTEVKTETATTSVDRSSTSMSLSATLNPVDPLQTLCEPAEYFRALQQLLTASTATSTQSPSKPSQSPQVAAVPSRGSAAVSSFSSSLRASTSASATSRAPTATTPALTPSSTTATSSQSSDFLSFLRSLGVTDHQQLLTAQTALAQSFGTHLPAPTDPTSIVSFLNAAAASYPAASNFFGVGDTGNETDDPTSPQSSSSEGGKKRVQVVSEAMKTISDEERVDLAELEAFANHFKKTRTRHGLTQGDVGQALGRRYGTDFSQTTISRFEALNLSYKNMCKLRPLLREWLEEAEAALAAGATSAQLLDRPSNGSKRQEESHSPDEALSAANAALAAAVGTGILPPSITDRNALNSSSTLKRRRKRTNLDLNQRAALDMYFQLDSRPDHDKMAEIADSLQLDRDVVRVWFCNRRQKERKFDEIAAASDPTRAAKKTVVVEKPAAESRPLSFHRMDDVFAAKHFKGSSPTV